MNLTTAVPGEARRGQVPLQRNLQRCVAWMRDDVSRWRRCPDGVPGWVGGLRWGFPVIGFVAEGFVVLIGMFGWTVGQSSPEVGIEVRGRTLEVFEAVLDTLGATVDLHGHENSR